MNIWIIAFFTFIATIIGGYIVFRYHDRHFKPIIAFTAGIFLAVSFLDLIPESFEIMGSTNNVGLFIVIGFLLFYILQRFTIIHACEEDECTYHKNEHIGMLGASGLIFHSLLDGFAIGLAFTINAQIAFIVSLAVIAHKLGDGIGLVSLMLHHKNSKSRSWLFLIIDALVPVIGIILANYLPLPELFVGYLLAFFAGFFIYLGASDLLPEAHHEDSSIRVIIATILGFLLIYLVGTFVTI